MEKRNIIVCGISIIFVMVFINVLIIVNNKKTFIRDGVTYAINIDNKPAINFPPKGIYRVDTDCENAVGKWDYELWKLYIEDVIGDVSCNISFTSITKTFLNDYLVDLSETTQESGSLVHETFTNALGTLVDTGYRYEGQDPNNYVWFNNELWRIIGVMNEGSHGQTDDASTPLKENMLVKIRKNDSIGGLVWHYSNENNWNSSSLKSLLNNYYLNSRNGTSSGVCAGSYNASAKCNYTTTGLKEYESMIEEVTWYLGGYSSNAITVDQMYEYERDGTSKYSSNPASVDAKIGLMYASDYGYGVPGNVEGCARKSTIINLSEYSLEKCTLNNWLYGTGYERSITPESSSSSKVFSVDLDGEMKSMILYFGVSTHPVLYLKSNVYVLDGDGSITDPYIIAMDEV